MTLKLYYDLLSQPSRALYIILKTSNVPFESCPVPVLQGAHLSDDFKHNVSRFQRVPVLHDGDFKLAESVAILRYLSNSHRVADVWYPPEPRRRALVDEYLEWQHNTIRTYCAMYFRKKWLPAMFGGEDLPEEKVAPYKRRMVDCLDSMESLWLSSSPYIAGDSITAADVWAACELEQPRIVGYDPAEGRPILAEWLERVRKEVGDAYREAHVPLNELAYKHQSKM